jgi:hypothetical protein
MSHTPVPKSPTAALGTKHDDIGTILGAANGGWLERLKK